MGKKNEERSIIVEKSLSPNFYFHTAACPQKIFTADFFFELDLPSKLAKNT
jgi:hypothetical protein